MADIKFGDIEYLTLLRLQDQLACRSFNKLDLLCLDKLKTEIHIKIEAIHLEHKERVNKKNKDNGQAE